MKKKLTIVGAIVAIILLILMGNKIYVVHEENVAKERFLELFSELEVKDIEIWTASKPSSPTGIYTSIELEEEEKEEFCVAMKSVIPEEITIGKEASEAKLPSFYIYTTKVGEWLFHFGGEVAYVVGSEEGSNEIYQEWPWEIRNEKLKEFFLVLYD